jgi:eukaryotic-like serine/threonine-protein kinase
LVRYEGVLPIHHSKPPKTLGRFEVGTKIGGGGMATVYLGRDVREDGTEALVALKVIRDELANDEQFTAMFVDEAKILARLSHPNVIQTLEYGVSGQHRFIAMELLNGRTVADLWDVLAADKEKFDLGVAAWVCARVAEGLHSAHELVDETGSPLSVVHRDVNPTNIFLTHTGEVKLIDFGLARARVRLSKSADGIVKGKIPYLAPEQAHGRPIDRRIDIYALGTTLWEMATMKRLFKRDNDVDTLKAIRDAAVPDPRKDSPDFPEALWKIIDRALRRDRDERYATAEEMRTDLDAFARATGPHVQKIAALVERLFPGGRARQEKWLRDAATVRIAAGTMAPPAPVPIASSSLLEGDEDGASIASAAAASPNAASRREADAERSEAKTSTRSKAEAPPRDEADEKSPSSRRSSKTSVRKSARAETHEERKREAKRQKRQQKRSEGSPQAPAAAEDKRQLWWIVAAVVAVLVILAVVASR